MRFLKVKRISAVVLAWIFLMGGIFWDVSPVRAEAGDISAMFDSSPDNTWLFVGGTETQGRYEEIQGRRNFTGDIEESIRKGSSGGAPEHQRYTINAGKAGRDLQGFLDEMDDYVQRVDPKAVSYLIEEEDYGKGEAGLKDFQDSLSELIQKALSLKENGGYVVIQTPHAVPGEKNAEAQRYAQAAKDTAAGFTEDSGRIKVVDHFAKTNADSFLNGNNLTETGRLNANGHFVIAEQFCREVAGAWNNSSPWSKNWEEKEAPAEYLTLRPEVISSLDGLTVHLPEGFDNTDGVFWHLEINGMEIEDTANTDTFTISDLPRGRDYKLTVYSKDRSVSLASVYGKVLDQAEGGERELNALQQKIVDKANGEKPLTWLFLGDSITHGLVHTKGYDSAAQAFEKYVKEDLQRKDDIVVNTGVSSTDTAWVLDNLDQRAEKYRPDVVFIMLGTNDVFTNINNYHTVDGKPLVITKELYCQNMEAIISRLRKANPDVSIVLRAPSPVNRESRNIYLDQKGYLSALEELAKEDGNILYVDQYREWDKELRTFPYMWNVNYYFNDSTLHPGVEGQMKMTRMIIDKCGLNTDTRFANLSYKFPYDEEKSTAEPPVINGDHRIKIEKRSLQQAYQEAGGEGTIGHLEICLTDENGRTYTQRTSADGMDFVMSGIPYGRYRVKVTGTRTDAAVHITFAEKTVNLTEELAEHSEIVLDRTGCMGLTAGDTAGVLSMGELGSDERFTYTLCSGDGSDDNACFTIKGRTLKITENLEADREYKIRIRAEKGSFQKETALVLEALQSLEAVRLKAQAAFLEDQTALDIDVSEFTFDGSSYIDLADASGSYYHEGAYLKALNYLKDHSTGGTILFRFQTKQQKALIFGAGSTLADDGKNMIFGLDSGLLRGYFRTAANSGLKGTMGGTLSDGKWHTVAMSFDSEKTDTRNQVLVCIDGESNCYPESWWTEAFRTWFNVNSAAIEQFAIGGGGYAQVNTFGAFSGKIDFVTITDQVYDETMLKVLSMEAGQKNVIAETGTIHVDGGNITVFGQDGCYVDHYIWNADRSEAEIYLKALEGYEFDEDILIRQLEGNGYAASVFWETAQEAYIKLEKVTEPDPPGPDDPEHGDKDTKKQLAAPEILSLKMVAEKKKAGVLVKVSKVAGGDIYTVYRIADGKIVQIGTTDADGAVYDENPINKKSASYYATAESQNPLYTKSPNGTAKSISLPAAVKKVTAKQKNKQAPVHISWKKVKGAKSYLIYRSEKKDTGFVRITKAKGVKKTVFDDKKVKKGKTYYYKIVVKTKTGFSAPKASKGMKIKK